MPSQGRNNWLEAEAQDGLALGTWQEVKELVPASCRVGKACIDTIIELFYLNDSAHVARTIPDGAFFPIQSLIFNLQSSIFPRLKMTKGGWER